ncbi:leucine-rich repeat-containing protein 53, partial [Clarias magur]
APDSTKALMLINGLIDTVDHIVFSDLSNMSVLVLSNNIISTITGNAFRNLTILRTLSLDHNLISSPSLDRLTFSWLRKLETLHLGHNALKEINGSWFLNTNSLKTLLLEGNLLTSLNLSTFASSDLRNLETLDLSDNLITYVGRDSFRNLPRLSSLDLSRNRLQNTPDAFSYLSRLSMLNLDLNRWNCNCDLGELAHFLNSYILSPENVLYNGKRMACTNSDNPKVLTVLELNAVNCMPATRNVTADVSAKSSITSQRYIRDVVIAVVCSCLGGVAITLAILAVVYRKLGKRFKPMQGVKGAEEQSSQTWDFSEGKEALSMSYALHNSNYRNRPPWDKEGTSSESRADTMANDFICQNCSSSFRRKTFHNRTNHQPNMEEEWSYLNSDQWKDPSSFKDE